jgi:diaminopimelate decarboxylase
MLTILDLNGTVFYTDFNYNHYITWKEVLYKMKTVPFSKSELEHIASTFHTPFYIYDEAAIRNNVQRLKNAFGWNQGFREYFAVKTTPTPGIIKLFQQEGCGAECASLTELMLAERCGFEGDDIMLTSNVTTVEEYQYASRLGAIINLDDAAHIPVLESCTGIPETICFRLNFGDQLKYGETVLIDFADSKFGSTKPQLEAAYPAVRNLGAKRFGLHTQFGCHKRDPEFFGINARRVFAFTVKLFEKAGIVIDFVNLAGGIGIPYHAEDEPTDIEAISMQIKKAYDETIGKSTLPPVSLYTELGIYMTGPYGYFVSRVLYVKQTYKAFVGLDASTNSFMSPSRYNNYHHVTVMGKESAEPVQRYDITGALCENRDRFAIDRLLPQINAGDLLVFHDAGAYAYSHSNNFNGRLRPAELLLHSDGNVSLIRRHETPDDYFSTMIF